MSSIPRTTAIRQELQYIAVAEMRNEVFEYSTSTVNFKTTGTFTAPYAAGGTKAVSIPAGTILVETGRKLFRGANPNVPTFLVQVSAYTPGTDKAADGVTDIKGNGQTLMYVSGRAVVGFIDPSSPNVALYSVSRSPDNDDGLYYSNVSDLNTGGNATTKAAIADAPGVAHRGPSLFTGGSLTAASIVSTGQIRSSTATPIPPVGTALSINPSASQVFTYAQAAVATLSLTVSPTPAAIGSVVYLIITASTTQNVITFSTGFKTVGTLTTGTVSGKVFTLTFISDGVNLNEVARTAAM